MTRPTDEFKKTDPSQAQDDRPTPFDSPSLRLVPRLEGVVRNYPLRERSDRMGDGPRAQRTGVWVMFVFPPWSYAGAISMQST